MGRVWGEEQFKIKKDFKLTLQTLDIAGAPGKNRTCGTWIRNPMLYPLSYGGRDEIGCEKKSRKKHLNSPIELSAYQIDIENSRLLYYRALKILPQNLSIIMFALLIGFMLYKAIKDCF